MKQFLSGHGPALRKCQKRGRDRTGRMGGRREVGVVECESAGAHGVDESRIQRIQPLGSPDHGGFTRAVELRKNAQHALDVVFA